MSTYTHLDHRYTAPCSALARTGILLQCGRALVSFSRILFFRLSLIFSRYQVPVSQSRVRLCLTGPVPSPLFSPRSVCERRFTAVFVRQRRRVSRVVARASKPVRRCYQRERGGGLLRRQSSRRVWLDARVPCRSCTRVVCSAHRLTDVLADCAKRPVFPRTVDGRCGRPCCVTTSRCLCIFLRVCLCSLAFARQPKLVCHESRSRLFAVPPLPTQSRSCGCGLAH